MSESGPQPAIELYKRVPGVRFLACGGDGTVGWVLSVLDQVYRLNKKPMISGFFTYFGEIFMITCMKDNVTILCGFSNFSENIRETIDL